MPDDQLKRQREYHRLYLSKNDLDRAVLHAQHFRDNKLLDLPSDDDDFFERFLVAEAFYLAAVISYSRPFTRGDDRDGSREDTIPAKALLDGLTAQERSDHHRIVDLRHKMLAHSDASVTQPWTFGTEGKVEGAMTSRGLGRIKSSVIDSVLTLAPKLRDRVQVRLEELAVGLEPDWRV